jgi:hypothetical protein
MEGGKTLKKRIHRRGLYRNVVSYFGAIMIAISLLSFSP